MVVADDGFTLEGWLRVLWSFLACSFVCSGPTLARMVQIVGRFLGIGGLCEIIGGTMESCGAVDIWRLEKSV
jgi:hypothetical protein